MARVTGVLLDVDGTLVDSNDAHAWAWAEAFSEHGLRVPLATIRPLIGMGSDRLVPAALPLPGMAAAAGELGATQQRRFRERWLRRVRPMPGARELVERVAAAGLPVAVATSAPPELLDPLLEVAGVAERLRIRASPEDVARSKPAPDVIEAALERLGRPAAEVVLVGDTPYDVEAGRRAGVRVVALRCGGWTDPALAGAAAIYDDPADLVARWDGSPLAGG